ncbi:hypothetical protein GCM10027026_13010 [Myroides odoratimimus subsp. xuanwuensis]
MAAVKGRRRRSADSGVTVPMQGHVSPETRLKARAVADALGVSMGQYLDTLVANDQLDEDGRPVWWIEPDPQQDALFERNAS